MHPQLNDQRSVHVPAAKITLTSASEWMDVSSQHGKPQQLTARGLVCFTVISRLVRPGMG